MTANAGPAVAQTAREVRAKAARVAAEMLECAPADVTGARVTGLRGRASGRGHGQDHGGLVGGLFRVPQAAL